jgi:hypothetical protein
MAVDEIINDAENKPVEETSAEDTPLEYMPGENLPGHEMITCEDGQAPAPYAISNVDKENKKPNYFDFVIFGIMCLFALTLLVAPQYTFYAICVFGVMVLVLLFVALINIARSLIEGINDRWIGQKN